jgi:hypothetical protein
MLECNRFKTAVCPQSNAGFEKIGQDYMTGTIPTVDFKERIWWVVLAQLNPLQLSLSSSSLNHT